MVAIYALHFHFLHLHLPFLGNGLDNRWELMNKIKRKSAEDKNGIVKITPVILNHQWGFTICNILITSNSTEVLTIK